MSSQSDDNSLGSEIDEIDVIYDIDDVHDDVGENDDAEVSDADDVKQTDDADKTDEENQVDEDDEGDEIDSDDTIKKLLEQVLDEVSNEESFDQAGDGGNLLSPSSASQKTRSPVYSIPRYSKPTARGRRPPAGPRGDRVSMPNERRNSRPFALVPRRGGMAPKTPRGEAEDGSSLFISNWGFRSNLVDQNGNFQRATTDLKNYIVSYKSKYLYFFDLVNGRYPQYVRTLPDKMEIWRMSFNVYASGFSEFISHLGKILFTFRN